jgi:hypothetical protein
VTLYQRCWYKVTSPENKVTFPEKYVKSWYNKAQRTGYFDNQTFYTLTVRDRGDTIQQHGHGPSSTQRFIYLNMERYGEAQAAEHGLNLLLEWVTNWDKRIMSLEGWVCWGQQDNAHQGQAQRKMTHSLNILFFIVDFLLCLIVYLI